MILAETSFEVARHVDCLDADADAKSLFHKSDDPVNSEHQTILFARAVNPEVRRRVTYFHSKALESGLLIRHAEISPPIIVSIYYGASARPSCINSHAHRNHEVRNLHKVSYRYSVKFLRIIASFYCACAGVLIIEVIFSKAFRRLSGKLI